MRDKGKKGRREGGVREKKRKEEEGKKEGEGRGE